MRSNNFRYGGVSYDEMIRRLFKTNLGGDNVHSALMHAAIGLAGELTSEFAQITSSKNFIEECGDVEFYLVAAKQQFPHDYEWETNFTTNKGFNLGNVADRLVLYSGDILDATKKSWVYGKSPDWPAIETRLNDIEEGLSFLYGLFGTNAEDVQMSNMTKLIGPGGRFASGFYSDAQAQARADKVDGE